MAAGTATAKGPGSGKGSGKSKAAVVYVFEGELASVGDDGKSFTLAVTGGNKAGRTAMAGGESLNLTVTPETRIELNDQVAALADLQAGDAVAVQSKAPKGATSFTARVISAEREVVEPAPSEPSA